MTSFLRRALKRAAEKDILKISNIPEAQEKSPFLVRITEAQIPPVREIGKMWSDILQKEHPDHVLLGPVARDFLPGTATRNLYVPGPDANYLFVEAPNKSRERLVPLGQADLSIPILTQICRAHAAIEAQGHPISPETNDKIQAFNTFFGLQQVSRRTPQTLVIEPNTPRMSLSS